MAFLMKVEETTLTPYILADEEKNYLRMEGHCYHENAVELFKEINEWLDKYLASDFPVFTFDCAINYLNNLNTKLLYNILLKLERNASAEKKIIVNWITSEDNAVMIECGKDIKNELTNITFNLVIH